MIIINYDTTKYLVHAYSVIKIKISCSTISHGATFRDLNKQTSKQVLFIYKYLCSRIKIIDIKYFSFHIVSAYSLTNMLFFCNEE